MADNSNDGCGCGCIAWIILFFVLAGLGLPWWGWVLFILIGLSMS